MLRKAHAPLMQRVHQDCLGSGAQESLQQCDVRQLADCVHAGHLQHGPDAHIREDVVQAFLVPAPHHVQHEAVHLAAAAAQLCESAGLNAKPSAQQNNLREHEGLLQCHAPSVSRHHELLEHQQQEDEGPPHRVTDHGCAMAAAFPQRLCHRRRELRGEAQRAGRRRAGLGRRRRRLGEARLPQRGRTAARKAWVLLRQHGPLQDHHQQHEPRELTELRAHLLHLAEVADADPNS
mmetsp:Transcript_22040/g.65757  ORF Transcript_22040/g.65757 Transcript_22040/m.65757 type:complete len:235 (-) Transcript_22040:183-887(-)